VNNLFFIRQVVVIILLAGAASGQERQPNPLFRSVPPKTEEIPTPSGTPEPQVAPDLLPESNQLPAESPDLRLPSPSILKPEGSNATQTLQVVNQLSPEEQEKNKPKLVEIRAISMRNPRVIGLLKEADGALTDEAKREFMRAYYHSLCTRMRSLEPTLGRTITEFERAEIRKLAAGPSHLSVVSGHLQSRERQRQSRRPQKMP
jgi:hypothetical protein